MVWQKNGTPDTLTSSGDAIQITDQVATLSNVALGHFIATGGNVLGAFRLNADSANNYSYRRSNNGGTDTTVTSTSSFPYAEISINESRLGVCYFVNISAEEKLMIRDEVGSQPAGAGNAPNRSERVGKWDNTATQSSQVSLINTSAGSFDTDSNLSALADVVPAPAAVGGWVELGRTTLGSAGDIIDVTSFSDKRYYMILGSLLPSGVIGNRSRVGTTTIDTGSNYAFRASRDGAVDSTTTSTANFDFPSLDSANDIFHVNYFANLSAQEKLTVQWSVGRQASGAGTAPNRSEGAGKWVNTSNPMQSYRDFNAGVGSYDTGSEVVVLGWDPTDTHTNNFWEEIFSEKLTSNTQEFDTGTITAKKYLWLQFYQVGHTGNTALTFNLDSGNNYARRHEINGAADATVVSQTSLLNVLTGGTGDTQTLTNMFIINNSANEKLMTFSTTFDNGAGSGTAPQKILGVCKWDNTAAQITRVVVADSGTGFNAPSFLKIWGSD